MTPEEFRRLGHQVVDWVADYRERAARLPVMSQVTPGAIKSQLPASPPQVPESFEAILGDVERVIAPGLSAPAAPALLRLLPANGELASVLGDFLSTGLGVLGLSWQSSPALTELEEVVCRLDASDAGLSEAWSGVIQDTASSEHAGGADLRPRARPVDTRSQARRAPGRRGRALVVYTSAQSHSSVEKAALLAGLRP